MTATSGVLLALTVIGTLYYVLSTAALARHFHRDRKPAMPPRPSVSVLKPVSGVDRNARANFDSHLRQDYGDYEVLFGVLNRDDPAVDEVMDAIRGTGNARLLIGSDVAGSNNKVRILHNLARNATGDVLVVTDADTRVSPDFLARITAPFEGPSVGAVTCMYRGAEAKGVGDMLEGLHMTCVFAPGVAAAEALGGIDFGLGAALAIRRSVLDRIGGFEAIADYLADDFQLCHRAARAGYLVELSDYVVEIVLSGERVGRVLERELRWSRTTRISRPIGHLGLVLTFGFTYAVGHLIASGFSCLGWWAIAATAAIRAVTAWYGARVCLGDVQATRMIWLLPVRDLLSFIIWVAGYMGSTVRWRGRKLRLLKHGRMAEVTAEPGHGKLGAN